MRPFVYQRADNTDALRETFIDASRTAPTESVQLLAGGTTLLDLMKLGVMHAERIVDINPLQRSGLGQIETRERGLRLGALVRMSQAAEHPAIQRDYPVLAQSLQLAASQQLRNMASLGGNVLQRTRCNYFRDVSYTECNKRQPGSGCAALNGYNRRHAILGVSQQCIATYPGDFAQALIALDAVIDIAGPKGVRTLAFGELHRRPGERPDIETTLAPGEVVISFTIPSGPWPRSLYLKVRDRESYEFAAASAAVAMVLEGQTVRDVRIGLGGVATVPWRAHEAEAALSGKELDEEVAVVAAKAAFRSATLADHNRYKAELGQATLVRALMTARVMEQ